MKMPNVIFISFDDLRPELGSYGNTEIITPNLDRFAERGVTFLNTYCQVAVCQPSRASYMTGIRPDSLQCWHLRDHHRGALPDVVTMPQYFHEFGYHTVSIGKIFHNHVPDSISFDEPDLRPDEYKTPEMVSRDAESFHYDDEITEVQLKLREEMKKARPGEVLYADGWGYGKSVESTDVPDVVMYDGAQTDLAIRTIERLKGLDKPFYLAMGYYRPHLPFVAPEKYWDMYDPDQISPASNPYLPVNAPLFAMNSTYELGACYDLKEFQRHPALGQLPDSIQRSLKHGYYASVSYVDACFGRLLDSLEAMGLMENTIIAIIGDHGWKLGEHGSWCKQTNYEIDTHVPLIVYAPGIKAAGEKSGKLTELVDIFPSLCELAGIEIPGYMQGTSFAPLLDNPRMDWKSAIFSQFHRRPQVAFDGLRYMGYGMRTERYHYIEWYYWDNENKIPLDYVTCELYDHSVDPEENLNIAVDPSNTELIAQLGSQLKAGWRAARPR
jgi:arylsulfatase A-like enzyme